jgi:hypothetical protein
MPGLAPRDVRCDTDIELGEEFGDVAEPIGADDQSVHLGSPLQTAWMIMILISIASENRYCYAPGRPTP